MKTMPSTIAVDFLFRLSAKVSPPIGISDGPQGSRMIVPAAGGSFAGPKLNGNILSGPGAEWATARPDGSLKADVRLALETDDKTIILMTYNGIAVPKGDSLTVRIAPLFEVAQGPYAWLNNVQAIGIGTPSKTGIVYDVFQVL